MKTCVELHRNENQPRIFQWFQVVATWNLWWLPSFATRARKIFRSLPTSRELSTEKPWLLRLLPLNKTYLNLRVFYNIHIYIYIHNIHTHIYRYIARLFSFRFWGISMQPGFKTSSGHFSNVQSTLCCSTVPTASDCKVCCSCSELLKLS
jgi:hypothetical protein